ncbi:symmetrical bis(5'-nucleosyl)-tetraphosphatase [Psychromonas sp. CD1]|uniref:symmetrical bis(5'-nucleosyl)-tetraphosphatase n=1 Tax=Psychromonas sp. CD1 TaxID=1979839 RepID=UPI000B9C5FE0|nr:symmetrical bis(5'-nucleosyl)-tetraphosphatase [Psychromonas sp. CD1]
MTTYIVGDVHGCFSELKQLLAWVNFNPKQDELWLTGDIVARGPHSLTTLRFVKNLGNAAKMILGNHDLHLLAIWQGIHKAQPQDKLDAILNAPDCDDLLHWLRHQPLLLRHPDFNYIMVHAGILPQWKIKDAEKLAQEAQQALSANDFKNVLKTMYSNKPNQWSETLQGDARIRFIINAFTRMRYCYLDGSLNFENKLSVINTNLNTIKPWYEFTRETKLPSILFGHWAALQGQVKQPNLYALDTGCVWGGTLSMLRWQDKKLFTCPSSIQP